MTGISVPTRYALECLVYRRAPEEAKTLPRLPHGALCRMLSGHDERSLEMATVTAPATGPQVGQRAPDWTLPRTDGGTLPLRSLAGKPVLLFFWASW